MINGDHVYIQLENNLFIYRGQGIYINPLHVLIHTIWVIKNKLLLVGK